MSEEKSGCRFIVYGEPVGKGRPRVVNRNGHSKAYTPKKTVNYEANVRMEYEINYLPEAIQPFDIVSKK